MPAMVLRDASGKVLDLQSLRGKPVLLNLWATWCAPCIAELPTLDALAAKREGQLRVVAVSQDMTDTGKVAPFLASRGLERLEPWLDPESELTFVIGAASLPTTVFYDAEGKEVWRYVGDSDWTGKDAEALLEASGVGGEK